MGGDCADNWGEVNVNGCVNVVLKEEGLCGAFDAQGYWVWFGGSIWVACIAWVVFGSMGGVVGRYETVAGGTGCGGGCGGVVGVDRARAYFLYALVCLYCL